MSERRRGAVLAALVVVAALGIALNSLLPVGAARQASPPRVGVALRPADTAAWYCAGPLPVGTRPSVSEVAIASLAGGELHGQVRTVSSTGSTSVVVVGVPAGRQVVVPLRRVGQAGYAAVSVLLDGAGAAVAEVVHGPGGIESTPCLSSTSTTSYFPAGSTAGADDLELGLFDPSPTPAVASVSVSTGTSQVAPPALQDLSIGAGQLVLVNVGREVPQQPVVATTVTTASGELAVGASYVFVKHGGGTSGSLSSGAPSPSRSWLFAPGPDGGGAREVFSVLDPGRTPAEVVVRAGPSPAADVSATVPAGGVLELALPAGASAARWATLTSLRGAPVVVARTSLVAPPVAPPSKPAKSGSAKSGSAKSGSAKSGSAKSGSAKSGSARRPEPTTSTTTTTTTLLPSARAAAARAVVVPVGGSSVELGSAGGARQWVLAGGESDAAVGEVLAIADLSPTAASVSILPLGLAAARPLVVTVPAGGLLVAPVSGSAAGGSLALVVRAGSDVVASSFLYERSGTAGFAAVPGVPVSG